MSREEDGKMYAIHYANGRTVGGFETHEDAVATIEGEYPDASIGHDGDISEGGDRTLCWADDESAENDDGARAIATIRVTR